MSDTDSTFNFLISMAYTQLFNLLCEKADDVYGGRLPVHVRCLIDEMANIGQIPNLEKLIATIRSREISACLVLQARSQLKSIYKDNADTIIGNCDSQIFLGGSEPTTLKELTEALGKETIDTFNTSDTRGNSPSYGTNYQKLGKELMSRDELAVMNGSKCILQLRGVWHFSTAQSVYCRLLSWHSVPVLVSGAPSTCWKVTATTTPARMLMYGKEASNRKQEIDRQHYTIPNQRPKDKHCGKI